VYRKLGKSRFSFIRILANAVSVNMSLSILIVLSAEENDRRLDDPLTANFYLNTRETF